MTRALTLALWGGVALTVAASVAAIALIVVSPDMPFWAGFGFRGYDVLLAAVTLGPAVAIIRRRALHPIGWLLLGTAVTSAAQAAADQYARVAHARGDASALAFVAGSVPQWLWISSIAFVVFVLLLFPSGSLPSLRWRPFAVGVAIGCGLLMVAFAVLPPQAFIADYAGYPVPDLLGVPLHSPLYAVADVLMLVLPVGLLGAFASLFFRARRASALERQQIKLLTYAAAYAGVAMLGVVLSIRADALVADLTELAAIGSFVVVMAAIGVAILRYRLYDIDVLINRTLVYAATTAALALVYVGSVLASGALVRPLTGTSDLAVAVSTLAVVALFGPVRARIQRAVDRRFYRSRYDAERTVDAFAGRLRDELDLDALSAELLAAVRETVRPARAGVWVRSAGR